MFLVVLAIVVVSTVLHELAHGVVAYFLGDTTARDSGRLTLNPFRHIDPYLSILVPMLLYLAGGPIFGGAKPVPVDSRRLRFGAFGMALVAVAGPLTNFLLAFIMFLVGYFTGGFIAVDGELYLGSGVVYEVLFQAVMINLGFFIFNMIPVPPLDGSRILYAIAPDGARRVMEGMERYGLIVVMALVVIFGGALSTIMTTGMRGVFDLFCFIVGA